MLREVRRELIIRRKCTEAVHASTVLPLADGRTLAAWFGGSAEGKDDVGIWLAERGEDGFAEPRLIAGGGTPHWNPVLFERTDGGILLFFKRGFRIPDWQTFVCASTDGGRNFSRPRELVPGDDSGGRGPVRNKPIRLKNGRVLAPASVERGLWRCFMDISEDDGTTWRRSAVITIPALERQRNLPHGRGIIQPTLWQDDAGIVHAFTRSGEGFIYRTDSFDMGETWSEPVPTAVPNNNSGIDLTRLPDGTLLLVCNPVSGNFAARTPLTVFASNDNGDTWRKQLDLESGEGEYSYPAIVSRGERVFITYTFRRENIAYREFLWR